MITRGEAQERALEELERADKPSLSVEEAQTVALIAIGYALLTLSLPDDRLPR